MLNYIFKHVIFKSALYSKEYFVWHRKYFGLEFVTHEIEIEFICNPVVLWLTAS